MPLLQIIVAIALIIILFILGFAIYNMEFLNAIRQRGVVKVQTPIFSGVKDLSIISNEMYHTTDKTNGSYKAIIPSYNQSSGLEYTYNFWLYIDRDKVFTSSCTDSTALIGDTGLNHTTLVSTTPSNQTNGAPIILFLKGHKELMTYNNICGKAKVDIMVKNPLVKLEQCGRYLTVEFNTIQSADAISENAPNICSPTNANWKAANAHKLTLPGFNKPEFDKKWCMVTIVIQDTYPSDPYPLRNKVRCRIYLNGIMELDRYVDGKLNIMGSRDDSASVLKSNDGNFFVAPSISRTIGTPAVTFTTYKPNTEKGLMMADLTYFNYALEIGEVDTLFTQEFNKQTAPVPGAAALESELYNIVTKPTEKQIKF